MTKVRSSTSKREGAAKVVEMACLHNKCCEGAFLCLASSWTVCLYLLKHRISRTLSHVDSGYDIIVMVAEGIGSAFRGYNGVREASCFRLTETWGQQNFGQKIVNPRR